jgi:hypothetical protein
MTNTTARTPVGPAAPRLVVVMDDPADGPDEAGQGEGDQRPRDQQVDQPDPVDGVALGRREHPELDVHEQGGQHHQAEQPAADPEQAEADQHDRGEGQRLPVAPGQAVAEQHHDVGQGGHDGQSAPSHQS